ncbi:hypothetical protein P6O80_15575, partial [Clostridium perfringens]|nr:hypothetical protein [Clostridium perfringens]
QAEEADEDDNSALAARQREHPAGEIDLAEGGVKAWQTRGGRGVYGMHCHEQRIRNEDGSVRHPFLDTLPFHDCEVLAALMETLAGVGLNNSR